MALGGALQLIPVVGAVWPAGFAVEYARRRLSGSSIAALPQWNAWGIYFRRGIAAWTLATIWFFPAALCTSLAAVYLGFGLLENIGWLSVSGSPWTLGAIFLAAGAVLGLAGCAVCPVSLLLYATDERFLAALQPGRLVTCLRSAPDTLARTYWLTLAPAALAGILTLTPPGLVLMLVAGPFVGFYLTLVWAAIWADWGRKIGFSAGTNSVY